MGFDALRTQAGRDLVRNFGQTSASGFCFTESDRPGWQCRRMERHHFLIIDPLNKKTMSLEAGQMAPDFEAKNEKGETVKLSDYRGKKVVLYFYPKDNTPGCTAEACDLSDNYSRFTAENYAIIGVSADSVKAQKKFQEKFSFPYPLIADEDKTFINAFGVWGPKKFMGKEYDGIHRTTFIIDEQGVIEKVITDVKTKNHTEQILV